MVFFQTKSPYLGSLGIDIVGLFNGHFAYFTTIWYVSRPFGIFYVKPFGMFHGYLAHFTTVWYVSWPFGMFCGHLVNFPLIWYVVPKKKWQPWSKYLRLVI
jgi:hypothetical protein